MKSNHTTFLSAAVSLLTGGLLIASGYTSTAQTQTLSGQQQLDSAVAIVADALGLPFVPADQRPLFGTYWQIRSSLPCVTAPLPFPPFDQSLPVYAVDSDHLFLVDETGGQVLCPLPPEYGSALSASDAASILQTQVAELQDFVTQTQTRQLIAQSSPSRSMAVLEEDDPPLENGPIFGTNDLWLEITGKSDDVASFVIHPPWNVTDGVYGLYFKTNLAIPYDWTWLLACASGQTNLVASNLPPAQAFFMLGDPTAIRPGFTNSILDRNDDFYTGVVSIGFGINFFGQLRTNLYVNNNGNVTFDSYLSYYTPTNLLALGRDIIAPFWADVDTQAANSGVATYGTNTVDGRAAFGVTWVDVGYYNWQDNKSNSFQLVVVDRSDRESGDFDLEFNYAKVKWEAGDLSGGEDGLWTGLNPNTTVHDGYGCSARAGYASASSSAFELSGSATGGGLLDTNPVTGLIHTNFNSTLPGRYVFQFHNGVPLGTP